MSKSFEEFIFDIKDKNNKEFYEDELIIAALLFPKLYFFKNNTKIMSKN